MSVRRLLLCMIALACPLALPQVSEAAKKQEKVVPVKIIKASETKFKHAKIVRPEKAKKKGFLWFRKKEPKVVEPQVKVVASESLVETEKLPVKEEKAVDPKARKAVELDDAKKQSRLVELPETQVPKDARSKLKATED
ncbi:hypothetical protein IEN85_05695 [Pelagicoccus sp. NFK12]|uniref:Uncharacterized protein n=1 Tax=Pelagicoccus enzymogenes TaxID=2773457 RepID=A0A927IGS2_9BACT|nr:hypothetical protein [Pelagicoccus enzymogenes]MBD5778978.1 hypothetical protein [Pelagicoccus enzymogenes]